MREEACVMKQKIINAEPSLRTIEFTIGLIIDEHAFISVSSLDSIVTGTVL